MRRKECENSSFRQDVTKEKNTFEIYKEIFKNEIHKPVMPREVLGFIPESGKLKIIDATVGCGGHSSLILKKNPAAELIGIDRDFKALEEASEKLKPFEKRARLIAGTFSEIENITADAGWLSADIILMDLGISSLQLDDSSRGFSYLREGKIDMRMNLNADKTAADLLNTLSENELEKIFSQYGEVRRAHKLAEEIVKQRKLAPFSTTSQLAELCRRIPGLTRMKGVSAPTLPFQALRIAVNDELSQLSKALKESLKILSKGGILIVISFNSLEDRIVKNFLKLESKDCICPSTLFECKCNHQQQLEILTKKPIIPADDEIKFNSRAAPAKLRAAKKI
ncbi:MAG TPA: 16S rRNA (cytosine(1402)-N(4))-methyltransferase RsmH [Victivallales bacterium]|nr:16S rRNA (cytosine(1402)-N(4))-methyltransferase RsmH [Victivallales bacterium]HRU01996.1 16S rRNA (cytosine(1402)-N(4))-methyltransferase RsmH [Victivallales bacterium]